MSIGITQLIILIIIGILLFGNLPKILKDLGSGIVALKKEVNNAGDKTKEGVISEQSEKRLLENKEIIDRDLKVKNSSIEISDKEK